MRSAAGLAAAGLILAACQTTTPTASPTPARSVSATPSIAPPVPQVLRLSLTDDPEQLDPVRSTGGPLLLSLTRPLAYVSQDLRTVPGLADRWEISPDARQITFHLGTHSYSDGEPIEAGDFVFSWRKAADPRIHADLAYLLEPIVGFADAQAATSKGAAAIDAALARLGVTAPDASTFVVSLSRPASYLVSIAALPFLAPEKAEFTYGEAAGYVSSGPMMLKAWVHGSGAVLVPNPYWNAENPDDSVTIDEIDLMVIKDSAVSLAAYGADALDLLALPDAEIALATLNPGLHRQIAARNGMDLAYFGFNMTDPRGPFARSRLLRRSFSEALDRDALLETVLAGTGAVANGLLPPGVAGHLDAPLIAHDPVQARADFDQALAELGTAPKDLHLELAYSVHLRNEAVAAFARAQWQGVFGIEIQLTPSDEVGTATFSLNARPFDIAWLGWGARYPHPNNLLAELISCSGARNPTGYCNPEVDALLALAAATPSLDGQVPIYAQVQEMVMADAPILPAIFLGRYGLIKPWVQGVAITGLDASVGERFLHRVTIAAH